MSQTDRPKQDLARRPERTARGFTLIEVMFAAAILGFSLVGLSFTAVAMSRNRGLATAQVEVGNLATEYLNEYVQWGASNLTIDGLGTFPVTQTILDPSGRQYQLTVHVTDSTSALGGSISKLVQVTLVYSPTVGSPVTQVVSAYVSQ